MPKSNARNYDKENERMGVANPIDLVLSHLQGQAEEEVQHKFQKDLIKFSQDQEDKITKAKEPKYLTIKGLLDHPYFIQISEADISLVIDEFEAFDGTKQ